MSHIGDNSLGDALMPEASCPKPKMSCPDESQIVDCLNGKLEEPVSRGLFAHLETCPRCQKLADDLDDVSDSFVQHVRASSSVMDANETCHQMIEHAEAFAVGEASDDFLNEWTDIPRRIRDYQILEPLGFGGMGEVYRARHIRLKRDVAIKLISTRRMHQDAALRFFQQEMEAVGRLEQHPHLVQAFDAGEHDGVQYLVMQLVDGLNAEQLLREAEFLSVPDACEIARQAALGLHFAHRQGLIHRDVKPSNLMIAAGGCVQVMDLGLSMFRSAEGAMKQVLGSVQYMAPEQADRQAEVDVRADIYGLGGTLYFLLTGQPPRSVSKREAVSSRLHQRTRALLPGLSETRKDVPNELREYIERMLAPAPEDRPSSAVEVARQLAAFTDGANLFELMADYRRGAECGQAIVAGLDETSAVGEEVQPSAFRSNLKIVVCGLLAVVGLVMSIAVWRTMFPSARGGTVGEITPPVESGLLGSAAEPLVPQRMEYQIGVREGAKQYTFTTSPGGALAAQILDVETGPADKAHTVETLTARDAIEFKLKHPEEYAVYQRNWPVSENCFDQLFPQPGSELPAHVDFARRVEAAEQSIRVSVREPHRSISLIESAQGRIHIAISFVGGRREAEFASFTDMKAQSGELTEIYQRYRPSGR